MLVYQLCAESFMMVLTAFVPHYIIGIALGAGIFGMFMLCEGFFKRKDDIAGYCKCRSMCCAASGRFAQYS